MFAEQLLWFIIRNKMWWQRKLPPLLWTIKYWHQLLSDYTVIVCLFVSRMGWVLSVLLSKLACLIETWEYRDAILEKEFINAKTLLATAIPVYFKINTFWRIMSSSLLIHYDLYIWINEIYAFNNPFNQCAVSVVDSTTTDADTSSLGVHLSVDIIEEIEMCCLEKIFD